MKTLYMIIYNNKCDYSCPTNANNFAKRLKEFFPDECYSIRYMLYTKAMLYPKNMTNNMEMFFDISAAKYVTKISAGNNRINNISNDIDVYYHQTNNCCMYPNACGYVWKTSYVTENVVFNKSLCSLIKKELINNAKDNLKNFFSNFTEEVMSNMQKMIEGAK